MDQTQKIKIMSDTASELIKVMEERMKQQTTLLNSLPLSYIESGDIPEQVKIQREIEAAKIRAVVMEQQAIIQLTRIMFPKPAIVKEVKEKRSR